jgi:hypothetical protein
MDPGYAGKLARCSECNECVLVPDAEYEVELEILEEDIPAIPPPLPATKPTSSFAEGMTSKELTTNPPVARKVQATRPGSLENPSGAGDPLEMAPEDYVIRVKMKTQYKTRRKAPGGSRSGVVIGVGVGLLVLWTAMTALGFLFKPAGIAMLVFGGALISVGTRWILILASQEGFGQYMGCLLVPFYDTWFTLSRFSVTWAPCLLCWAGRAITVSAIAILCVHFFRAARDESALWDTPMDPKTQAAEVDKECEKLLKESSTAEARNWLEEPNKKRGFFKWGKKRPLAFVKDLYSRGAKTVTVADIETDTLLGEIGTHLVITLPDDSQKRKAVLAFLNETFEDEEEPRTDHGQKYELVTLD